MADKQPPVKIGRNGKPRYRSTQRYTVKPRLTLRLFRRHALRDDFLGHRGTGIGVRRVGSLQRWRDFLRSKLTNPGTPQK